MSAADVRAKALAIASTQVGVREASRNSGPEVDVYLHGVGLGPGFAWCAAFVHWCFDQASAAFGLGNPCPRTAGALHLWELCPPLWRLDPDEVVVPGDVFVIDHGHGLGHVGFVELVRDDGRLQTIEGNTNASGGREGDGVYRRTRRRDEITRGYVQVGGV